MGKRTWFKVYGDKWLEGTLREETPEFRGIWIDLLSLVCSSPNSDTGQVTLKNGIGYTDEQIATIFNIPLDAWERAKKRLIQTDRIQVSLKNTITITNWSKYQSDYQRQKPYRQDE